MSEFYPTDTSSEPILHHIYALVDPRDSRVRYVGVTLQSLQARFRAHLNTAQRIMANGKWFEVTRKAKWLRSLQAKGLCAKVELIETTIDRSREMYWIAEYKRLGYDLTNLQESLDGRSVQSEETKRKIAASHIGIRPNAETCRKISEAKTGKKIKPRKNYQPVSDETRRKISETLRGRVHSPETRRKISESNRGRIISEEARAKSSKTLTGRKLSAEHIRNAANGLLGGKRTKETKLKMSMAQRGRVFSDETKAKMREGQARRHARRRNMELSAEETGKKHNNQPASTRDAVGQLAWVLA